MGHVRQARNAAGGGAWARAMACACAVGLAVLFPQLAWADAGTGQVETTTEQAEAAAQGKTPGAVCVPSEVAQPVEAVTGRGSADLTDTPVVGPTASGSSVSKATEKAMTVKGSEATDGLVARGATVAEEPDEPEGTEAATNPVMAPDESVAGKKAEATDGSAARGATVTEVANEPEAATAGPAAISIHDAEVGLSGDYSYTGEAITPSVRVSLAGQELREGIDYEVSYRDNVELGTATVTVTGLGDHVGVATASFDIKATQEVLRLYNRWTGEHLYTTNRAEYDSLGRRGWSGEGVAWTAPGSSSSPVWRLYNRWSGDHLLTSNRKEYDALGRLGWNREGIGFYGGGNASVWRLYNKWLKAGTHLLTTDKTEYDNLIKDGWSGEGVAFGAVSARKGQTDSQRREAEARRRKGEIRAAIDRNPRSVNDGDVVTVTGKVVCLRGDTHDSYSVKLERPLSIRNIRAHWDRGHTQTVDTLVVVKWIHDGGSFTGWSDEYMNVRTRWFANYVGKMVTVAGTVYVGGSRLIALGPWLGNPRLIKVW